jgi:hypothetical protein
VVKQQEKRCLSGHKGIKQNVKGGGRAIGAVHSRKKFVVYLFVY